MDEIEDDPDFEGIEYYELPALDSPSKLYSGDRFFHTEGRFLLTINTVKAKIRTDRAGDPLDAEDATHYIFYEPNWTPHGDPTQPHHYTEDIHTVKVGNFERDLDGTVLIPNRGNGLPRRPP
jgi:hypothetical protein